MKAILVISDKELRFSISLSFLDVMAVTPQQPGSSGPRMGWSPVAFMTPISVSDVSK